MSARQAALQVLTSCRTHGAWADAALKAQLNQGTLSPQDAALCSRIVYGVIQNRLLLDYYLGAFCTQKIDHLQLPLPDILRIGAYQILFLDKVPDSAAVNESVNLAKKNGREAASGLVNAVLRKLSREKDHLPELPQKDHVTRLSLKYSHPKWLVKRICSLLGEKEAEAFFHANNSVAPLTVQCNPMKITLETLIKELSAFQIEAKPHAWVSECAEWIGGGDVTTLPAFREGKFMVQDPAARLVTMAAGVKPGDRVLDVCAAPGGKSFSAAYTMKNQGSIVSCDLHENKLKRIREGAERLGITCITTIAADGREFRSEWQSSFDVVMVDAPCSGLGIIRKKPDIRYKKADDLFTLPVVQSAILENAARYVKPGGTLLYSTCTVLPEENEQITAAFLAENPGFCQEKMPITLENDGSLTLWPHRHGTDGFYLCRMKRHV